jgi:16S rRNA (guanine527-N7)-methyltransferase
MDRARLASAASDLGLDLTVDQLEAFERYEEALYQANAMMNLTRVPREECWLRHFVDSLLFQDLVPAGAKVLDIGTGPGFPAWPLAVARPDLAVTALDSSGKMTGFLRTVPLPNLAVVTERAEDWGRREEFDVVTGRALAPLPIQLELSAPPCRTGGLLVPMRTPAEEEQIRALDVSGLGLRLEGLVSRPLSGSDIVRLFPVYVKLMATPRSFPRRWAEIRARPIGGA